MVPQLNLPNAKKDVPARLGGNLLPRIKTSSIAIFGQRCPLVYRDLIRRHTIDHLPIWSENKKWVNFIAYSFLVNNASFVFPHLYHYCRRNGDHLSPG